MGRQGGQNSEAPPPQRAAGPSNPHLHQMQESPSLEVVSSGCQTPSPHTEKSRELLPTTQTKTATLVLVEFPPHSVTFPQRWAESAWMAQESDCVHLSPNLPSGTSCFSLKSATVGVFTPWKLADAAIRASFPESPS